MAPSPQIFLVREMVYVDDANVFNRDQLTLPFLKPDTKSGAINSSSVHTSVARRLQKVDFPNDLETWIRNALPTSNHANSPGFEEIKIAAG